MTADSEERYRRLLDHVERGEPVWTVAGDEGQALWELADRGPTVPFWTSREAAQAAADAFWEGDTPVEVDPADLIDRLDAMAGEDELAGIEPDGDEGSMWLAPAEEVLGDVMERLGRSGRDPYAPSEEDADRIWNADSEARADWFVRRVAADDGAWGIGDEEGLLTFTSDDGQIVWMLWPHAVFARRFADEEGIEHELQRLAWDHLMNELDRAAERGEVVAVFPTPGHDVASEDPQELRRKLKEAQESLGSS